MDRTDRPDRPDKEQDFGVESYEQKLDRYREGWRKDLDEDLEAGR